MPVIRSAKKALRQSIQRRGRNLIKKESYKKAVKVFRKLVAEKKNEEAQKHLASVYKALDKAVKTGVIKINKSSRLKSRLSRLLKKD